MKLNYQLYKFVIEFEENLIIKNNLFFLLRNNFGKNLKKITCILKRYICENCPVSHVCLYNLLFEGFLTEKTTLTGSNYIPKPLILSFKPSPENSIKKLELDITLLGDAIKYFSYVFYALYKTGLIGISKRKNKFKILSIKYNGEEILINDNIKLPDTNSTFYFDLKDIINYFTITTNNNVYFNDYCYNIDSKEYQIIIFSPLRIKKNGKFLFSPDVKDIIKSFLRRLSILIKFFGTGFDRNIFIEAYKIIDKINFNVLEMNLKWKNQYFYSFKQKSKIKMGGVIGNIIFNVKEYKFIIDFLDNIFNAINIFKTGKNTNLGFGNLLISENIKIKIPDNKGVMGGSSKY